MSKNTAIIAAEIKVPARQINAVIDLLDEGNTIPFIARYRKEATGELDEEQIRSIQSSLEKLRLLDERRETVLKSITEQGKLTDKLRTRILEAPSRTILEDLYQPFKPKRKTRASIARSRGLRPLADMVLEQSLTDQALSKLAEPYMNEEIPSVEAAWEGARDIVAEVISDHSDVRRLTREKALQWSTLEVVKVKKAEDPRQVYKAYYKFSLGVNRIRPHQVLAINRGEKEKILRVRVKIQERDWRYAINSSFKPDRRSPLYEQFRLAMEDAANRLLLPSIERDIRRTLTETAEKHAINVFAGNLMSLLSLPPLSGHTILGIDPGYRTGCKVAVVDTTGKVLDSATIYPHQPQNQVEKSTRVVKDLIDKHRVDLVAIGNGTASHETEQFTAALIKEQSPGTIQYLVVSEAGASVYSASKLARTELPGMDVSMRGAVSIARRVQDPLAELVKIDPRSIGVGMYQHDVDQKALNQSLTGVVEQVVNQVGVDVNTASPSLLTYTAGIGPTVAEKIVAYRDKNGAFSSRESLLNVPGFGPKAFEQSAGFLRVHNGKNPLDNSAIHPESYHAAAKILEKTGIQITDPVEKRETEINNLRANTPIDELAGEFQIGVPTLEDILDQIIQPGRDPRETVPPPILRTDVLKMEDLVQGMTLLGTVRNVVDFGAFIDIGVKQDGLLHRSQIPGGERLQVGDILKVGINEVDQNRGRISLSWIER